MLWSSTDHLFLIHQVINKWAFGSKCSATTIFHTVFHNNVSHNVFSLKIIVASVITELWMSCVHVCHLLAFVLTKDSVIHFWMLYVKHIFCRPIFFFFLNGSNKCGISQSNYLCDWSCLVSTVQKCDIYFCSYSYWHQGIPEKPMEAISPPPPPCPQ